MLWPGSSSPSVAGCRIPGPWELGSSTAPGRMAKLGFVLALAATAMLLLRAFRGARVGWAVGRVGRWGRWVASTDVGIDAGTGGSLGARGSPGGKCSPSRPSAEKQLAVKSHQIVLTKPHCPSIFSQTTSKITKKKLHKWKTTEPLLLPFLPCKIWHGGILKADVP